MEDAKFIVLAVNSHAKMLAALRKVRNEYRQMVWKSNQREDARGSRLLAEIARAIAKAEGKRL